MKAKGAGPKAHCISGRNMSVKLRAGANASLIGSSDHFDV